MSTPTRTGNRTLTVNHLVDHHGDQLPLLLEQDTDRFVARVRNRAEHPILVPLLLPLTGINVYSALFHCGAIPLVHRARPVFQNPQIFVSVYVWDVAHPAAASQLDD